MNCDEAFDLMTHPTDHNSEELVWHLELCPRCQQMKETLAPALEPLHQFLEDLSETDELTEFFADAQQTSDQESASALPQTRKPFLSEESVRMAEQAATRLRTAAGTSQVTKQTHKSKPYQKRLMQAALILLAGFLMGWGISSGGPGSHYLPSGVNGLSSQQPCLWVAQRDSAANPTDIQNRDQASVNKVVLSCVACHLQSTAE
ncbi:MAG: hypothetical protein K0U86_05260 [Planctomycetes bacterium]|nr:hypothetical protein [Planctomycetota bacterium]MCH9724297.1 hypothetical protein [Planctomycetota bacterium]MCH9777316.1 hypothetical protein [Planctomycetota bacterium]MCH9793000.1 hypothetical protein [Planctomycetota bacterium]MDF1742377.1 hypothetical protein [Gimesia sp.]